MKVSSSEGVHKMTKLVNTKQPQGMIELFIQTTGKRKFTNWSKHLEEPYESRGSRTVLRGAGGEIPLAYSTERMANMIFFEVASTLYFIDFDEYKYSLKKSFNSFCNYESLIYCSLVIILIRSV